MSDPYTYYDQQFECPSGAQEPDDLSDVPQDILHKNYREVNLGQLTPQEATEWMTPASSSDLAPNSEWSSDPGFPNNPSVFQGAYQNNIDVGANHGWSNQWSRNQVLPHAPGNVPGNFQNSFAVAPNHGWSSDRVSPYESNNFQGPFQSDTGALHPDSARWGHTKPRSSPHRSPARSKSPSSNHRVSPYHDRSGRTHRTASPSEREDSKQAQAKCSHSESSETEPIATVVASEVQSTSHENTYFRAKLSPASIASLKQISELIPKTKRGPYRFTGDVYDFCSTDGDKGDVFRLKTYLKLFEYYGYKTPVPYPVKNDQRRHDGAGALAKGLERVRDYALSDETGEITISEEAFSTVESIIEISEKLDDIQMTITKLVGGSLSTRKSEELVDEALKALINIRDKNEFPTDPSAIQDLNRVLADHYPAKGLIEELEWLRNKQLTGEFDSFIQRENL